METARLSAAPYFRGSELQKADFSRAFTAALEKDGWVILTDFEWEPEEIEEMFEWNTRLFNAAKEWASNGMPLEEKDISHRHPPRPSRGYGAINQEKIWMLRSEHNTEEGSSQDLKEYFDMGPPADMRYPTPFPPESILPGFSEYMQRTYWRFQGLSTQLASALELGLGLHQGALTRKCELTSSELRLNHYPKSESSHRKKLRSAIHTDLGVLTLLFTDGVGGLEFENRASGAFEPVEMRRGKEVLVNVADTLERWTNGVLRSGLHRVNDVSEADATEMSERRSVAFFYKADMDETVGPLDAFVSQSSPAKYEAVTVREYIGQKHARLYG